MTDKPNPGDDNTTRESAGENDDKPGAKGLAEKSVTEYHLPGADGPPGAGLRKTTTHSAFFGVGLRLDGALV